MRPGNTRRPVPADYLSIGVFTDDFINKQILGDDDIAFHADNFSDVSYAAGTITQSGCLYDNVNRTADHFLDCLRGKREAAHGDHGFEARKGFAWAVGVERSHGAVMTGV